MTPKIITLLTDFGTRDGYVGSVKGVIKSIAPDAEIIDISHDIVTYDIGEAAFTLNNYYDNFPRGTVHLAVVDPGVGSPRRAAIVKTARHFYVGPDNGIFHFIYSQEAYTSYEIDPSKLGAAQVSHTFHARDLFAPVAARLANGVPCERLGIKLDERTEIPRPYFRKAGSELEVDVITIDRFGNIISGFAQRDLERLKKKRVEYVKAKGFNTVEVNDYYSEKQPGELMALWNSRGFLEVAANRGSAAALLSFDKNKDKILIKLG